ncbi:MAG TPA: DUF3137 domain-containing protein [Dysgonamonadaceae bacterium]|nr:DUF3137 domain-containing protein [Dysgonamonadaceae bacterium]
MKKETAFKSFYSTTILPMLIEIDKLRRKIRLKNFYTFLAYIGFIALLFLIGFLVNRMIYGVWIDDNKANVPIIIVVIILIISFIYFLGKINTNKKVFVDRYKNDIIGTIVKFIDESLLYEANNKIAEKEFIASKLFHHNPNRYNGDDYVSGKIDKTEIAFSEVHAKYKTETVDEDGSTREKWRSLFDGLFFKADFNKDFKGEYFLFPESLGKMFGQANKFFLRAKKQFGEPIHLEDIEFEKEFVVYGSDQVEARYILSSSLMKRLLDFKRQTGKKIKISFVNSSLYIAIPYKKPLFEPGYYSSVINEKKIKEYYLDLEMDVGIVKDLNLNTRIWRKQ